MENKYELLCEILKKDTRFLDSEGVLLKNKIQEFANKMDTDLLKLLYSDPYTKDLFFKDVDNTAIFDKVEFAWVIDSQSFLPDSYTKYINQIMLTDEYGNSIRKNSAVVLEFPNKDCVLEMDATVDKEERNEVFLNEQLMKKEVDCLLAPKVFTNPVKFDKDGMHAVTEIMAKDNLIIKGNNLIALHCLLPKYNGMIKLMYWDILYNTDSDKVPYNDSFKHSSWLTMMKNRLEVAHKLLARDGLIFIQCDDKEMAYLKVLCDEIFTRDNGYVNTVTVKTKIAGVSGSSEGKSLIDATEFILIYAKDKSCIYLKPANWGTPLINVLNDYKESGKSWKYTTVLIDKGNRELLFEDVERGYTYYAYKDTKTQSVSQFSASNNISEEEVYTKHFDKIFRTTNAQSSVRATVEQKTGNLPYDFVGLEYVPIKGKNAGKKIEILYKGASRAMVTSLSEMIIMDGDVPLYKDRISTIWTDIDYNNLKKEGGVELPFGKKPEKLVSRILDLCVNEGDIVLDAYLGTGTTAAVAHKRGARYIGIEQLDSHMELAKKRLNNVINGDTTGVSKEFEWNGGGSFVFFELAKNSQTIIDRIGKSTTSAELLSIYNELKQSDFVLYRVDINKMESQSNSFESLSIEDKKKVLKTIIDKNTLYINYSDIDNADYNISTNDKLFTETFYKGGES